jgi:hypothetical protein
MRTQGCVALWVAQNSTIFSEFSRVGQAIGEDAAGAPQSVVGAVVVTTDHTPMFAR